MKAFVFFGILAFGFSSVCLGLETESRSLLPAGGRSPAEAGLESGRYQELSKEEMRDWEKRHGSEDPEKVPAESKSPPKVKTRD